jgi:DNA-binding CsgD family transcriptional regulator/GAF domain-containing protein
VTIVIHSLYVNGESHSAEANLLVVTKARGTRMFWPVGEEVGSTEFEGLLNVLCSRVGRLLESGQSGAAGRGELEELGELSLSVEEAWATGELEPERARGLMGAAAVLRSELHDAVVRGRSRVFGRINDGLASIARFGSLVELVERAPALLCEVGEFDRAMISRVQGSTWMPAAVHVAAGEQDQVNMALVGAVKALEIPLTGSLIETEMLRRRTAVLVDATTVDRHTVGGLAELSRSRAYVAAPILIADHVAGFVHADAYSTQRVLTVADRVAIEVFADLFGLVYERAMIAERLIGQNQAISEALTAAAQTVAEIGAPRAAQLARTELHPSGRRSEAVMPAVGDRGAGSALTSREWEILRLLATGATNGQIAAALIVSESTVKSHVKRILHKLPAANRAEAVYRYTRMAGERSRVS